MTNHIRKTVPDYDCVVIGAGPAGLTAAMNLGFEGLKALVIDGQQQPGGQAGTSHLIENLPGFPNGITGPALTATLVEHAAKFKVDFQMPFEATRIESNENGTFVLIGTDHDEICARSIMLATGVQRRLLKAKNVARYIGRGIAYGSPAMTTGLWKDTHVGIVGGANSAAQAAMFLTGCENCRVTMFVRDPKLEKGMSAHVAEFFQKERDNLSVLTSATIEEALGDELRFTGVIAKSGDRVEQYPLTHLFVQIGASPHTAFLGDLVGINDKKYVVTGREIPSQAWNLERRPLSCETSHPGIFASGDVRAGNTRKRVATAAGDGATAAASVFEYLSWPQAQPTKTAVAA